MKISELISQEFREKLSVECATVNMEASKTIQGPAAEADINLIAKQFGLTASGPLPVIPPEFFNPALFDDHSEAPEDLQAAFLRVQAATEYFEHLPAGIRRKFNHSPTEMWYWLQDADHHKEAVDLGLLHEFVTKPPIAPEVPA
jgi:hypothetical protein